MKTLIEKSYALGEHTGLVKLVNTKEGLELHHVFLKPKRKLTVHQLYYKRNERLTNKAIGMARFDLLCHYTGAK